MENRKYSLFKNKLGISLVVLVIMIIVMIILAGVTIMILDSTGVFDKAKESIFKNALKSYQEQLELYYSEEMLNNNALKRENITAELSSDTSNAPVLTYIKNMKSEHIPYISIENGELKYNVADTVSEYEMKKAYWACQLGYLVNDLTSCDDVYNVGKTPYLIGAFIDGVCTPNLTGFNIAKTRYISFTSKGEIKIGDTIEKPPPNEWYDYTNNIWANIVVENDGNYAYFVWIPRYEYKTADGKVTYIDKNQVTPSDGYKIPESFIWDMTDTGGTVKQLSGFWMSKYKLSDKDIRYMDFTYKVQKNPLSYSIEVSNVVVAVSSGTIIYDYYIAKEGESLEKKETTTATNYTYTALKTGNTYDVYIVAYLKDVNGNVTTISGSVKKTIYIDKVEEPNLIGFNQNITKYINIDEFENETVGNNISGSAPDNWYDYNNNKWANIVVENDYYRPYFVWIPRYEYREYNYNGATKIDINYIPKTKIKPTLGYKIPESFIWDMTDDGGTIKHLSGFWMSKYKLSDKDIYYTDFIYKIQKEDSSYNIYIQDVQIASVPAGTITYEYYIAEKGNKLEKKAESTNKTYTFINLTENKTYNVYIKAYIKDANGVVTTMVGDACKTIYTYLPTTPNTTGFNEDTTKYVTWNDDETEEIDGGYISEGDPPNNWYDYTNNKWANIFAENGSSRAYFTWIPRYEYREYNYNGTTKIEINFIPKTKIAASTGFQIPESFTWDMTSSGGSKVNLAGFWMSKYKLSDIP